MLDADAEARRLILYLVEYMFGRTSGRAFPPYDDWRVSSPNAHKEDSDLSFEEWAYKEKLQELSHLQLHALYDDVRKAEDRARGQQRISEIRPSAHGPVKQRRSIIRGDHRALREADQRQLFPDELSALRQADEERTALREKVEELQNALRDADEERAALREEVEKLQKALREADEGRAALQEQVKKLQSNPANKSAQTKVDNTRLRMIYGMARAKFALKLGSHYDSVATNIARALHLQDIDIAVDTVRNHLKDAIKLCEQPVEKEENPRTTDL